MGHLLVAHALVKGQAALVLVGDDGIDDLIALQKQQLFQSVIELLADALSLVIPVDIDGSLGAPGIAGPLKGRAAVGIAENFAAFFINYPGIFLLDFRNSSGKFRKGRNFIFKSYGCFFDIGRIDFKNRFCVLFCCKTK